MIPAESHLTNEVLLFSKIFRFLFEHYCYLYYPEFKKKKDQASPGDEKSGKYLNICSEFPSDVNCPAGASKHLK